MRTSNFFYVTILTCWPAPLAIADEGLFGRLDKNQDGQLAADEIGEQHQRLFARLLRSADDDRDGRLTSSEFQISLRPRQTEKPLVKKVGSEMPGADALLLLLAKMDVNTNGQIESKEVPSQLRQVFDTLEERLGGQRDGVLDRRELAQSAPRLSNIAMRMAERMKLDVEVELALLPDKQWRSVQNMLGPRQRGEPLADPERAREFFRRIDANGDGQVALDEVPDQIAERFEQLLERADRNRDEQISEQELMAVSRRLQAAAADRPSPAQVKKNVDRLLKQLDRNRDGKVSRNEAPPRMQGRFDRLDRNGNGSLNRAELVAAAEMLGRVRQTEARTLGDSEEMMQPE